MNINTKISGFFKNCYTAVKLFFTERDTATKSKLSKLDYVDIFISLAPAAIFGCLLFGFRAVSVLLICTLLPLGIDFLWNLILLKKKTAPDYTLAVSGLILGLTLSSRLNFLLVVAVSILTTVLTKLLFKKSPIKVIYPLLIVRVVTGTIFFKAFGIYNFPFLNTQAEALPIDYVFGSTSFIYPAKYLFFGIHSGNIGETSVLLLLVGAIYLMLRKIINPVIPACYIATVTVLSLAFGRVVATSLLGGSLFFVALFLTLDYSLKKAPRYKKILYGICCGILTFGMRELLRTEGALYAILITHIIFLYVNRKNIKRVVRGFKSIDFKSMFCKSKDIFLKIKGVFKKKV